MENIYDFLNSFYTNDKIEVVDVNYIENEGDSQATMLENKNFKQSFIEGIIKFNNCDFEWVDPNNADIIGKAKILSIEKIIDAWVIDEDDIAFDEEEDGHLVNFRVVDRVQEEWCVGIFFGENASNTLYLYEWDGTPQYLGLDMESYVKMLIATRGFNCWQQALRQYKSGKETTNALSVMKEHLPRLFPELNIDEVFALYDSLYVNEEIVPDSE